METKVRKSGFYGLSLCTLALVLLLGACSTNKDTKDKNLEGAPAPSPTTVEETTPVEQMYNQAARLLDSQRYFEAARQFDEVERQHPYSKWATRAQLMAGYAHYKDMKYDEALLALERFIQLHPGDENIAYAWYLKALCYYEQISDVRRDQRMTELALNSLTQVVERFPDSKYARDAGLKIDLTKDHLAGKEMEIGRYYLRRGHYQAGINRFEKVLQDYQTTTHVPEALHRLTESWLALGVEKEARRYASILGHNYPDSDWYKDSYKLLTGKTLDNETAENKKSFLGKLF